MFSALSVAAGVLLGACSDGDETLGPAASLGTAPTTTSTTARPIDPAVIPEDPADIDEAYVQAVVDALFAVDAQATKIFVETRRMDEEAMDILASIYTPDELAQQLDVWFKSLARGGEHLLPGALENEVTRMIGQADDCLFFEVQVDFSATTDLDVSRSLNYLGLTPKQAGDDPAGSNPTAWMLFTDGVNLDGSEPEDPCIGR